MQHKQLEKNFYSSLIVTILRIMVFAVFYYICARFSLMFSFMKTNASPIWPPSGLALAVLWIYGYRICPGIFVGAFWANSVTFLVNKFSTPGVVIAISFVIALGNMLEAVLGRFLLGRWIGNANPLFKVEDVLKFLVIAMLAGLSNSLIGPTVLCLSGSVSWEFFPTVWFTWWLGDVAGILTITPLFFIFRRYYRKIKWRMSFILEGLFVILVLILTDVGIFGGNFLNGKLNFLCGYLLLPVVVWAAYRFGPAGATLTVLMTLGIAIAGTVKGMGPFVHENLHLSFLSLLSSIAAISMVGLILAAAIKERQQAEEALRRSEFRFRSLVENSADMIALINAEATFLYASPSTTKILGYETQEYVGSNAFDFIHPDDNQEIREVLGQVLSHPKSVVQASCRFRHKDGSWRWLEGTGNNLLQDPTIKAIVVNYRDITERKNAQLALQESEWRFRQMADTAPVMIWMSGADTLCHFFNKAWLDFTGQIMEHEIGEGWAEGVHIEDKERCLRIYLKAFEAREEFTMDYRLRRHDGEYRWILDTGVPRFMGGQFEGYIGSCIDITERKLAEEILKRDTQGLKKLVEEGSRELIKTQNDLKQATRLADIGTLAATVAHELRTPLGVIQMAAFNLKRKWQELSTDRHILNIEKKVWEGNQIINNLLSYSRIKAPSYQRVQIFKILEESILTVGHRFEDFAVFVDRQYSSKEILLISADPVQLIEVFNNILINAYQAFPEKEGTIELLAQAIDNRFIKIVVKDNGMGIEEEDLKKVFDPFFTRKAKGTGLGLTICNELVNLHEGRIEISSEKGFGTTVSIFLPIKHDDKE